MKYSSGVHNSWAKADWVKRFRTDKEPTHKRQAVADLLNKLSIQYPDQSVNSIASDCSRSLIASWIPKSNDSEKRRLLQSLRSLVPSDRLLRRDCDRFLTNEHTQAKPTIKLIHNKTQNIQLIKTIQLGTTGKFKTAICYRDTIYAISTDSYQLNLTRCNWEGDVDKSSLIWHLPYGATKSTILLSGYITATGSGLLLHAVGHPLITGSRSFSSTDLFSHRVTAGAVSGMSPDLLTASNARIGTNLLEVRNGYLNLISLGGNGRELASMILEYPQEKIVQPKFYSLHNRNEINYLGLENELWFIEKNKVQHKIEMEYPITSISSGEHGRHCLLTHAQGCSLFLGDTKNGSYSKEIPSDLKWPVGCINHGNYVIIAGDNQCQIFSSSRDETKFIAEFPMDDERPIAVLPAPQSNRFGMVTESGKFLIYEIRD
ncbi:MAG: hypothetical protein QM501_09925 [Gimesia sp.]